MAVRHAEATWHGTLKEGAGTMKVASGYFDVPFTFGSRFEEDKGTNPEELIGAAHAGCFSMFLSSLLTNAGHPPTRVHTTATVHLRQGPTITLIELKTEVLAPGLEDARLQELAIEAKAKCPVSKALVGGPEIQLTAQLV